MLNDVKLAYESCADSFVPNWRNMSKNELVRKASLESDKATREGYISAIMYLYWNKLVSYYYKSNYTTYPEDVHEWLVNSVMYAINNKPWENPSSSIYNDENGPDKVINRCMESRRKTYYQQLNRYNRKINSDTISLDGLVEEYKDSVMPETVDANNSEIYDLCKKYFTNKDYITGFILDTIYFVEVPNDDMIVPRFAAKIRKVSDEYLSKLSSRYEVDYDALLECFRTHQAMSNYMLRKKVEYYILRIKTLIEEGEL